MIPAPYTPRTPRPLGHVRYLGAGRTQITYRFWPVVGAWVGCALGFLALVGIACLIVLQVQKAPPHP